MKTERQKIKRKATITDVARYAGVSVSTVSVVVNNSEKFVEPRLRERILKAVKELNYYPNSIARSLKYQKTKTIGLVLTNITSPVTPIMVRTIQKITSTEGIDILIVSTEENKQTEKKAVDNFISRMIDGLIICPVASQDYSHLQNAKENCGIPVISIERKLPEEVNIPCVISNNEEISYQAMQHLIGHGRKRIALLTMPVYGSNTRERIVGCIRALSEAGLYHPALVCEADYLGLNAYELTQELIKKWKIDAIFAISQSLALGAYKAIMDCGLSIPEDVAMIAYDSVDWMNVVPCPITCVKQPMEEIATISANMLLHEQFNKDAGFQHIVVPSQIVIQHSCGC
ncbi:MAG: LacI family transcriptional regulator [Chloroflexi bacterium]|nr:LacI family transcriptional regulator [Chloroflexota bacterium]